MRAHGKDRSGGPGERSNIAAWVRGGSKCSIDGGVDIHSRRENKGSTQVFRIGGRTAAVWVEQISSRHVIGLLPPRLYCNNRQSHAAILPSVKRRESLGQTLLLLLLLLRSLIPLFFLSSSLSLSLVFSSSPPRPTQSTPSDRVPWTPFSKPFRAELAIYSRYLYAGIYEQIIIGGMFRHFSAKLLLFILWYPADR